MRQSNVVHSSLQILCKQLCTAADLEAAIKTLYVNVNSMPAQTQLQSHLLFACAIEQVAQSLLLTKGKIIQRDSGQFRHMVLRRRCCQAGAVTLANEPVQISQQTAVAKN